MKGQRTQCLGSSSAKLSYLMFLVSVGSAAGLSWKDCSSSCGEIESIRYPFRLKSDPPQCGNPKYELICSGNRTILEVHSGKYYVTNISYVYSYVEIRVVNVEWASGKCAVPSRFVSPYAAMDSPYQLNPLHAENCWFGFVNCSEKIPDKFSYKPVPCLNGNSNNNGSIYVVSNGCSPINASSLAPSCGFLSEVPTERDFNIDISQQLEREIFRQLKMGFVFSGSNRRCAATAYEMIIECLGDTMRTAQYLFVIDKHIFIRMLLILLLPLSFDANVVECLLEYHQDQNINFVPALVQASVLILLTNIAFFVTVFYILGRFVFGPLCMIVFLCHNFRKMRTPMDKVEKFLRFGRQNLETTRYSYHEIVSMTGHFKVKLGQGGFGSVYRGNLPGGYPVAVKMLGNSKCNGDDFISEVSTIGRIRHLNVVRLIGFCSEGTKLAIVYELMSNGSLDKYIFSSNRHFTKEKLNEIALGVARGIDYLHRGCDMRILHFDIKPQNILLDHNFHPKVSDFGLARLYSKDYSIVSISVARGTVGYIAPELVSRCFGAVSTKSDVYSFGMLLMEMAGARRNYDRGVENSSQCYYPSWIYDRLQQMEESGDEICDDFEIDDMERKLCKVGLACIQTRASDRPPMSRVVEMLQADADTLPMPPKPFVSNSEPVAVVGHSDTGSSLSELSIISE